MSASLNVLCPNGRRQMVKVNANTKILDIIDEVCKKQGYNPNEFDLIHQRKTLDISLTYRLSGIPNNAQLELKKLENGPRQFQNVTIALQMDDGSRLPQQEQFKPDSTSLLNVIEVFSKNNPDYFTKETFDDKSNYELGIFPTISYLNDQIVGLYQLKNTSLKDLGLTGGRSIIRFHYKQINKSDYDKMNQEFKEKLDKQNRLKEIYENKKIDVQEIALQKMNEQGENRDKIEKREKSEPPIDVIQAEKKMKYNTSDVEMKSIRSESNFASIQESSMSSAINTSNEFVNFKFPEETKGQQLNEMNELAEIEKLSKEPCDRQALLFNMEEIEPSDIQRTEELNDEFFDVTVQDLRYMLNDLKQRQTEDTPLMTKQMREMEQDRKAMKYTQIVVRIAFSNSRLVLQGLFRPKERVSNLYDFVRQFIHSTDAQDLDFYLFTSPPKLILNQMKTTLFESKLCPASLIYFKNKSERLPQFKDSISIKTLREANEIVYKEVHQKMRLDIESHEGMNWLKEEQSIVRNIFNKATNKGDNSTSGQYIDYESTSSTSKRDGNDDPVKKKLERFLGSRK
jgi:tether containing UBX domain for GLUT4